VGQLSQSALCTAPGLESWLAVDAPLLPSLRGSTASLAAPASAVAACCAVDSVAASVELLAPCTASGSAAMVSIKCGEAPAGADSSAKTFARRC